jgi:hypothetical protein
MYRRQIPCEKDENAMEIMLLLFVRYKLGIDTEKVRITTKTVNFKFC